MKKIYLFLIAIIFNQFNNIDLFGQDVWLPSTGASLSTGVGIGTTMNNPAEKLVINGNMDLYSTTNSYKIGQVTVLSTPYVGAGSNLNLGISSGINLIGTNYSNCYLGNYAGQNTGTVTYGGVYENVFVGNHAGEGASGNIGATRSVYVGFAAGQNATGGQKNCIIGWETGLVNTGDFNSFFGSEAGQSNTSGKENVFVGKDAGLYNTTTNLNTYIGRSAGLYLSGGGNVFVGASCGAGTAGGDGTFNSFLGNEAGLSIQTGDFNTLLGYQAGNAIYDGNNNVCVGKVSGKLITSGSNNSLVGNSSGAAINTGEFNTSVGYNSSAVLTSGNYNTLLGSNTNLTYGAGVSPGPGEYRTAVGASAKVQCDHCMVLGDGSTSQNYKVGIGTDIPAGNLVVADMSGTSGSTDIRFEDLPTNTLTNVLCWNTSNGKISKSAKFIKSETCSTTNYIPMFTGGNDINCSIMAQNDAAALCGGGTHSTIGIGYGSVAAIPGNNLLVPCNDIVFAVNGFAGSTLGWIAISDKKFKENIEPLNSSLDKILKLNPKSFNFVKKNDYGLNFSEGRHYGFLAQEVEDIFPDLVINTNQNYKMLNYTELIPILSEGMQEQNIIIQNQNKEIDLLKNKIKDLNDCVNSFCSLNQNNSRVLIENEKLSNDYNWIEQNTPNPFNELTYINYFLANPKNSKIEIYSINGIIINRYENLSAGKGQVEISANTLKPGIYVYHLIVNNKTIDSKIMTVTK